MKQFNLQEYLEHLNKKVITGNGEEVEILKTNVKSNHYKVVGLIKRNGCEIVCTWDEFGLPFSDFKDYKSKLFFADEELTEFEKELTKAYKWAKSIDREDFVKEFSPKLLDIARKQLQLESNKKLDSYIFEMAKDKYHECYDKGKEDALKEKNFVDIDKACEWIENNYINECGYIAYGNADITFQQGIAIEKFKKAMLEE